MTDHALLLVNLGSPASTEVADVRRYLNQFLMDPYVIDLPWPLRRLIVSIILAKRPPESAHAYASIWWPEGSPLIVISKRLQDKVKAYWPHGPVALAMRYGEPSIERVLGELAAKGVKRLTIAPLYPQFADSTTTTVLKEVERVIKAHGLHFEQTVLPPFYDQPVYIEAMYESAKPYLEQPFDHLLLSFHGLPERHIRKLTNPVDRNYDICSSSTEGVSDELMARSYRSQCLRTAEAFAARAGLAPEQWSVSFQSRLGRAKWIEPYTENRLDELGRAGVRKLLVMSPAFVADCIETLEELGIRGSEQFTEAGGEQLQLIPCLNDQDVWAQALVQLCEQTAE